RRPCLQTRSLRTKQLNCSDATRHSRHERPRSLKLRRITLSIQSPSDCGASLKATPPFEAPPTDVAVKDSLLRPRVRPATGFCPSAQFVREQKLYSTLSVQLPSEFGVSLKTTPQPALEQE